LWGKKARVLICPFFCPPLSIFFHVTQHGVGNWKAILNDPSLHFDNRSPVDLKDRCVSLYARATLYSSL
jgi:hypothetical protein